MSFEEILAVVTRLGAGTDALGAIAGHAALLAEGKEIDVRLAKAFGEVEAAVGITGLEALPAQQLAVLSGMPRLFVREADLQMSDPGRPPVWNYTDPALLETYGRGSSVMPQLISTSVPEAGDVTSFLDVGVGVGWLAIAAAQQWPAAHVVGIDVWAPSLERARAHVAESGFDGRVELRDQDAGALDDVDAFDCAWLPTFFFDDAELPAVVERVVRAVRPGGAVVLGRFDPAPDPLIQATTHLRAVRSGGSSMTVEEGLALLRAAGCSTVRAVPRTWPMPLQFVVGQP